MIEAAAARKINLRALGTDRIVIALDETVTVEGYRRHRRVLRRRDGGAGVAGRTRQRCGCGDTGVAPAQQRIPHAPGLPSSPLRNRDAALHAPARGEGSFAHLGDDSARLVHHEAQCHDRDDAGELAGIRQHPSVRAARADGWVPRDVPAAGRGSLRDHRASAPSRCSRTRGRRANTPGCSPSAPTIARAAKEGATSA